MVLAVPSRLVMMGTMVPIEFSDHSVELCHQGVRRRVQRAGDANDDRERRVASSAFDLGQVLEADACARSDVGLRQLVTAPQFAEPVAKDAADPVVACFVGHGRIVRITPAQPSRRRHFALSSSIYGRTQ